MDARIVSTLQVLCQGLNDSAASSSPTEATEVQFQNMSYRKRKRRDGTEVTILECTAGELEVAIFLKRRKSCQLVSATSAPTLSLNDNCLSIVLGYIPHIAHLACLTGAIPRGVLSADLRSLVLAHPHANLWVADDDSDSLHLLTHAYGKRTGCISTVSNIKVDSLCECLRSGKQVFYAQLVKKWARNGSVRCLQRNLELQVYSIALTRLASTPDWVQSIAKENLREARKLIMRFEEVVEATLLTKRLNDRQRLFVLRKLTESDGRLERLFAGRKGVPCTKWTVAFMASAIPFQEALRKELLSETNYLRRFVFGRISGRADAELEAELDE